MHALVVLLQVLLFCTASFSVAVKLPAINPDCASNNNAISFLRSKRIYSIEKLQEALKNIDRKNFWRWYGLGTSYRHSAAPSMGLAHLIFTHLIALKGLASKQRSMSFIGLSKIAERSKNKELALDLASQAMDSDSHNPHALKWYADVLFFTRETPNINIEEAISYWEEAISIFENSRFNKEYARIACRAHLSLGRILTLREAHGHYLEAVRLAYLVGEESLLIKSLLTLARYYCGTKQNRKRINVLQDVLMVDAQNAAAIQALKEAGI